MEVLDLRHFTSGDLRSLLEQENDVWARLLSWDYSASADMILRYVDAKILPGYAAVERGMLYGYSFFVYEGAKGVIGDLYVQPMNGSRGNHGEYATEQKLLTHVISTLQSSPGIRRIEAQLLVHETGAVARPFLERSFQRYPRLFMMYPLKTTPHSEVQLAPGIEIRHWSEADYQDVASVITLAYRGHIDSEINDQYRSVTGSLRFLNNIVRFPGCGVFDAASSFIAYHRPSRAIIGAILCSRVKDDVGHVTQVCVLPEYRGKHIGEALLSATANELRRRNFAHISLTVTEANHGAVELYKRLGYSINRIFDAFVWEG
jgi:ribosomal protein S18 acetylase RimI-like enzyme